MFARPGLCGMGIGRLGLVAASQPSLVAQALAILAKYGSAANLYLPGVGAINGITAGNWLDSAGTTPATVDGQVGRVDNARGGVNLTQSTAANRPVLRRGLVNQLLWGGDFSNAAWLKNNSGTGLLPVVTANTTTTPLGQSASTVVLDSGTGGNAVDSSRVRQGVAGLTVGATYTHAYWMRTTDGATRIISVRDGIGGITSALVTVTATWSLQVLTGTATSTTSVVNLWLRGGTGSSSYASVQVASALFAGAVTAQQIIDAGGIPVTTTAPASSINGSYALDFVSNDSFTSTMTPGNAGFFCTAANVTDSGVLRTLLGAGAGSDASSGVWLARAASNALTLQAGNGTTRNSVSAAYPVAANAVASAGWDSSAMFVGINNTETSNAKTVNCTSSNTINVGVLAGTTNPMLGTIGAIIIMPTVLPTVSERATLRQLISSLSGVIM